VPDENIQKEVEGQLKDDKWVTLEKEDGSSEILTKSDIPIDDEDKELMGLMNDVPKAKTIVKPKTTVTKPTTQREEWTSKFANVKSATSTHKAKGG